MKSNQEMFEGFIGCMFADLNNITEGSDEQVKQELVDMGINLEKAQESFMATIRRCNANFLRKKEVE